MLATVVSLRALLLSGRLTPALERPLELLLVAGLAVVALPLLLRGGRSRARSCGARARAARRGVDRSDHGARHVRGAAQRHAVLFLSERSDCRAAGAGSSPARSCSESCRSRRARGVGVGAWSGDRPFATPEPSCRVRCSRRRSRCRCSPRRPTCSACITARSCSSCPAASRRASARARTLVRWPAPRAFAVVIAIATARARAVVRANVRRHARRVRDAGRGPRVDRDPRAPARVRGAAAASVVIESPLAAFVVTALVETLLALPRSPWTAGVPLARRLTDVPLANF